MDMMHVDVQKEWKDKFELSDGQVRSDRNGFPFAKNQYCYIASPWMGPNERHYQFFYGDLSEDDVIRIAETLRKGEIMTCFNESDGMRARALFKSCFELQQIPRVIITCDDIRFPRDEEVEDTINLVEGFMVDRLKRGSKR